MCQAFSCLVLPDSLVIWKLGIDSHEDLIAMAGLEDDTANREKMAFCRVEILPKNKNYIYPDTWELKIDQPRPAWWSSEHAEAAIKAHKEWLTELNKILIKKPIINPFKKIIPPKRITKKHRNLIKTCIDIWTGMDFSIPDSVYETIKNSAGVSIADNILDMVICPMLNSVWIGSMACANASVWAYIGSFFNLPYSAWKHTENIKIYGYPFQPFVDLWEMGLVLNFDGENWNLHGGKRGRELCEVKPMKDKVIVKWIK